jgi:hypothetical protein
MQKIMGNLYKDIENTYNLDGTNKMGSKRERGKGFRRSEKNRDHGEFFSSLKTAKFRSTAVRGPCDRDHRRKENNSKKQRHVREISDVFGKIISRFECGQGLPR